MSVIVITIDGPASSGKGTVAKIVAEKLGYHYLESGAIYRTLGLMSQQYCLSDNEVERLLQLIKTMDVQFKDWHTILNGEDVTDLLRDEKIGLLASKLAKIPEVRTAVLDFQREFATLPGLVTDGRDMGSVVFPNARLKIFLTASADVRAERRYKQLQLTDKSVTITAILRDIESRDLEDTKRKVAPLFYDDSFKFLDNSKLTIDETVNQILRWKAENCI